MRAQWIVPQLQNGMNKSLTFKWITQLCSPEKGRRRFRHVSSRRYICIL